MAKFVKIIVGMGLLGFSLLYLLGIILVAVDMNDSATYSAEHYLEWEFVSCEPITQVEVIADEELLERVGDRICYELNFTVYNRSSQRYYGNPAEAIWLEDVYEIVYEEQDSDYEKLFYQAAEPSLPGRVEVTVCLYAFIDPEKEMIRASYYPNWDSDEISMDIPLNSSGL